jgi:hypothetical protein
MVEEAEPFQDRSIAWESITSGAILALKFGTRRRLNP